jgi:carbonic anhydrase
MSIVRTTAMVFVTAAVLGSASLASAAEKAHWGYEGQEGPGHWATLSPEYSACAGKSQSPVDLVQARMIEAELPAIVFSYQSTPLNVTNNGHTIQVDYAGNSTIQLDGRTFHLKQFHFHSPSENLIDGRSYAIEAHLVHADDEGNLAVIAVMIETGPANTFLDKVWRSMPAAVGGRSQPGGVAVDVSDLLPANRDYYRYDGSLTTPPCTEGVRWLVLKRPVTASQKQVDAFRHVMHHANNRPVQPLNARVVLK